LQSGVNTGVLHDLTEDCGGRAPCAPARLRCRLLGALAHEYGGRATDLAVMRLDNDRLAALES